MIFIFILCLKHLNKRKGKIRVTTLWSKAKTRERYIVSTKIYLPNDWTEDRVT